MSQNGYIKLHRKILDNPVVCKDSDYFAVWVYLLLNATHCGCEVMFGGERTMLKPGEFTTGRKRIASDLNISESKVQRILKRFESEHQIEQRTDRQCRLISIVSWDKYQENEQRNEQQVNNDRTTSEQRVNTKQECKNEKNEKNVRNNKDIYTQERKEIIDYLNEICGTSYRPNTNKTKELINARLREGFTVDDFKAVIFKKAKQWKDDQKMCKYLRPETLFGTKFEGYLNEHSVMSFEERLAIV